MAKPISLIQATAPVSPTLLEALESNPQFQEIEAGRSITDDTRLPVIFRHSGWQPQRRLIAESLARTNQTFTRRQSFLHCGSHAYVLRNVEDPTRYRIAGSSCHDRFCLPCAKERSSVIAHNVLDLIKQKKVRFLTLTLKASPVPLSDSLDKLYASFQTLRRRSLWTRAVDSGVAFLELTWSSRSERWHPHLHCLIEGRWLDQAKLKRLWYQITTDSFIVDIRRPSNSGAIAAYVTKYASKPFNTSFLQKTALLDEAIVALQGRKLAVTFGRWRGVLLTKKPDDGTWEHVGTLDDFIIRAAHGDTDARQILESLATDDLTDLYARAPPHTHTVSLPCHSSSQRTWFHDWHKNHTCVYLASL